MRLNFSVGRYGGQSVQRLESPYGAEVLGLLISPIMGVTTLILIKSVCSKLEECAHWFGNGMDRMCGH
jgi:hypothetical protein